MVNQKLEQLSGQDLADSDLITPEVALDILQAWQLEYERLSVLFRQSLSPEQKAMKAAMSNAANERDRARYWRGWRMGKIRFSHRRRILPRYPGQPQYEVTLDLVQD